MGPKPIPGTAFVSTALLVVSLGVSAALPATAQGLGDGIREDFRKAMVEGCIETGATNPDLAELPKAKLRSICLCSAAYIATHATPAQFDRPDSLAMRAIVAEATRACFVAKQPA